MRILLILGVVMMTGALCSAAVVVAKVIGDNEREQAVTPIVSPDPVKPAPVEPDPVEPVEESAGQGEEYDRPTLNIPDEPAPEVAERPTQKKLGLPQELIGSVASADTRTLIRVKTCDGGSFRLSVAEKRMFALHNRARTTRGLKPLCVAPDLTRIARIRSQDMLDRDYFSHHTPDGESVVDYVEPMRKPGPGHKYMVGENLAKGGDGTDTDTPASAFDGLMHSRGHRENILKKEFREVGIGARSGMYQQYDDVSTIYTSVFGAWITY